MNEELRKGDIVEQKLSRFGNFLSKLKHKYLSDVEVVLFGKIFNNSLVI